MYKHNCFQTASYKMALISLEVFWFDAGSSLLSVFWRWRWGVEKRMATEISAFGRAGPARLGRGIHHSLHAAWLAGETSLVQMAHWAGLADKTGAQPTTGTTVPWRQRETATLSMDQVSKGHPMEYRSQTLLTRLKSPVIQLYFPPMTLSCYLASWLWSARHCLVPLSTQPLFYLLKDLLGISILYIPIYRWETEAQGW